MPDELSSETGRTLSPVGGVNNCSVDSHIVEICNKNLSWFLQACFCIGFAYKYAPLKQLNRWQCSCALGLHRNMHPLSNYTYCIVHVFQLNQMSTVLPKINLLDMANCDGHSVSRLMSACCKEGRGAGEILRWTGLCNWASPIAPERLCGANTHSCIL